MMVFLAFIIAFVGMEFIAWFSHKYIMHGLLWSVHEDHHRPHKNKFEKNDLFFLIFAVPSWLCIMLGFFNAQGISIAIGFGIMSYGFLYFLIHDVLIHRRFKWFDNTNNRYFKAIRKAHKVHHKNMNKEEGACFGMLIVPLKYFREQKTT